MRTVKETVFFAFILVVISQFAMAQAPSKAYYKFGQNGIELISKTETGTDVISTFNAKMTIKNEIARNFYLKYLNNEVKSDSIMVVLGKEAKVTGKCKIIKKDKMTSINFYYEKVEWVSGLVEEYRN
jgi:hypothetical protein